MKLLTVCVPCHNAIEYMHKALGSCLVMKDELEVIIVDNNSDDGTYEVSLEYQKEYPDTFKVIRNESNQSALKLALDNSQGLYFKLLYSYDWFDSTSLMESIKTLKDILRIQANLDVLVTDYMYNYENKRKVISYKGTLPKDRIFGWHEFKMISQHRFLQGTSLIVKRKIVDDVAKKVTDSMFTADLYAYAVFPYVKSFFYLDAPLYCYGRNPKTMQTLNESSEHLIKMTNEAIEYYDIFSLKSRRQRSYLVRYLALQVLITNYMMTIREESELRNSFNTSLEDNYPKLYKAIKKTTYGKAALYKGKASQPLLKNMITLLKFIYKI